MIWQLSIKPEKEKIKGITDRYRLINYLFGFEHSIIDTLIFQVRPDVPVPVFTLMVVPVVDLAVSTYTGNRFESIANFTERSTTFFFRTSASRSGRNTLSSVLPLGLSSAHKNYICNSLFGK